MPIGDLGSKVSGSSFDKLNARDNVPEFESGFESGVDFNDIFDSLEDDFGSSGDFDSDFGRSSGFDGLDSLGDSGSSGGGFSNGFNDFNGGFSNSLDTYNDYRGFNGQPGMSGIGAGYVVNNPQAQVKPVEVKPDLLDTLIEFLIEGVKIILPVSKDFISSIKSRNYDDIADYRFELLDRRNNVIVVVV